MPNMFGGGFDVGQTGPYESEKAQVLRKQRLAEMLMRQGMQAPQAQQGGRFTVPISPLQGLAQVFSGGAGAHLQNKAGEQSADIAQRQKAERADYLARALNQSQGSPQPAPELGGGPEMPSDPVGAMGTLAQAQDPMLMQLGSPSIKMQADLLRRKEDQEFKGKEAAEARTAREARETSERAWREQQAAAARDQQRSMAELTASLRPQPQQRQPQIVQTENGPMILGDDGVARPIPGPGGAPVKPPAKPPKPLSEFQGRNVLFGSRMASADKTLLDLEDKISTTGLAAKQGAQNIPLIGGMLGAAGNVLLSNSQQRVEQAQRDFVNAVLRQESGAVINPEEFDNAKKQYFPQPGDGDEVVAQKRHNRRIAIEAFKQLAGPGAEQIDLLTNMPRLPGNPVDGTPDSDVVDFNKLPKDRRER